MGAREVAAGAAWLDENFPGWEREIDLGTLKMNDCQACICGQSLRKVAERAGVFSGYDYAKKVNGGLYLGGLEWVRDHGFTTKTVSFAEWQELEHLWRDLIKERFNSGNLSDN